MGERNDDARRRHDADTFAEGATQIALVWATRAEEPDRRGIPSLDLWPEYNLHGDVITRVWGRLTEEVPHLQSVCMDERTGEVLIETHTVACHWDGSDDDLGSGIDEMLRRAFDALDDGRPVNTLCALAAEVAPGVQSQGLATAALQQMLRTARAHDLGAVIAPVRPSWKEWYPLTPIEEYVEWRRDDDLPFDPWMRVHERLGGRRGPALPRSLRITGTVGEWEEWLDLPLPASGRYVFRRGLAPLEVDRERDIGEYHEPNVWYVHDAGTGAGAEQD